MSNQTSNPGVTPETEFAVKKQLAREIDEAMRRAYPGEKFGVIAIWMRPGPDGQARTEFTSNIQDTNVVANALRSILAQILKGALRKATKANVKARD